MCCLYEKFWWTYRKFIHKQTLHGIAWLGKLAFTGKFSIQIRLMQLMMWMQKKIILDITIDSWDWFLELAEIAYDLVYKEYCQDFSDPISMFASVLEIPFY